MGSWDLYKGFLEIKRVLQREARSDWSSIRYMMKLLHKTPLNVFRDIRAYFFRCFKYKTLSIRKQNTRKQRAKKKRNKARFIAEAGECKWCKSKENLTLDHKVPKSKGGSVFKKKNWQVLCSKCNHEKKDKVFKTYLK